MVVWEDCSTEQVLQKGTDSDADGVDVVDAGAGAGNVDASSGRFEKEVGTESVSYWLANRSTGDEMDSMGSMDPGYCC